MNDFSAVQRYQEARADTASPTALVVMLYEGAIRFVHEATDAIEQRDIPRRAHAINRALKIVHELSNALDHDQGGEISPRLQALYEYVDYELLQATTFNDTRHTRNAVRVLQRLLESWRLLANRAPESPTPAETTSAPRAESSAPPTPAAPSTPTPSSSPTYEPQPNSGPSLSISA